MSSDLARSLSQPKTLVIALSGGIDSLTLSAAAAFVRGRQDLLLCHAISPAVPKMATKRVRQFAKEHSLNLKILDAGEFRDPDYIANPINRCYFCKTNLYKRLAEVGGDVATGTNVDDLSDFRPGLDAAREHRILHPFVDAGLGKAQVRELARALGLGEIADLPASPCLASRIETGLKVEPAELRSIDKIETNLRAELGEITLRCRRTKNRLVIEVTPEVLASLDEGRLRHIRRSAREEADALGFSDLPLSIQAYKKGSAFIHVR